MNEVEAINRLGEFCGVRDVPVLTPGALRSRIGRERVDVMALFGGSILAGGEVLARAMEADIARKYVIVGGEGHTTPDLRRRMREVCPGLETEGLSEAELFDAWLRRRLGRGADALETASTNCGNNITLMLKLLEREGIPLGSILLCQDATMQRRMDAGLRRHRPDCTVVNYAAYRASVRQTPEGLDYAERIRGMWDVPRYVSLLLGEIPRLRDDAEGYGPRGRGFIAHVDVPGEVLEAWESLKTRYVVRRAKTDAGRRET